MPVTKPGIKLTFGICQACLHHEQRKFVDWKRRKDELVSLCQDYRLRKASLEYENKDSGSPYDCICTGSGGKDSHYQLHILKEIGFNPLFVSVADPYKPTAAGTHNFYNIRDKFNVDAIQFHISPDLVRRMTRIAFEELGSPTWAIDKAIYAMPLQAAINYNIPLVFYGENVSYEYGGVQDEETASAKEQINNTVVKQVEKDFWSQHGISEKEMGFLKMPANVDRCDVRYLSYYVPWSGRKSYEVAKEYGFTSLDGEWDRQGFIENYDQIDSAAYLMNPWLKWPKYGFGRVTDVAGYWIRDGVMTKEEALGVIKEKDGILDPKILNDFLEFTGYTEKEFWAIVDKFYNKDIFKKVNGEWK
jgi:N-acetyl sugar amidotransferase